MDSDFNLKLMILKQKYFKKYKDYEAIVIKNHIFAH